MLCSLYELPTLCQATTFLSPSFFLPIGLQMRLSLCIYMSLKSLHKIHNPANSHLLLTDFTVCHLYIFSLMYISPLIPRLFMPSSEECLYTSLCLADFDSDLTPSESRRFGTLVNSSNYFIFFYS